MLINKFIILAYNRLMSTKIINKKGKVFRRIRAMLFHNICYRCEVEFGNKNPDRIFYVIRSRQSEIGFFGLYNYVVDGIIEAVKLGAEPVVDWQHYPNDYLSDDSTMGKKNAWEMFFEPMSGVSLEEVYKSKHVIMSDGVYKDGGRVGYEYSHPEEMKATSEYIRKYIVLKKDHKELLDKKASELKIDELRVLGVKCRGTDFKETQPKFHAICPGAQQTADIIDEKEKEWGRFDRIFVVTEDAVMFEEIRSIYGDRVISCESQRIESANGKWLNELYSQKNFMDKYNSILEYLISVYLLARCNALIAPMVGATNGAMRIRGEYEKSHIIQMGSYK